MFDFLQDDYKYGCRHSCGWRVDPPKCRPTGKNLEKNVLKLKFLEIINITRKGLILMAVDAVAIFCSTL